MNKGQGQNFLGWMFSGAGAAMVANGLMYRFTVGNWGTTQGYVVQFGIGLFLFVLGTALTFLEDNDEL